MVGECVEFQGFDLIYQVFQKKKEVIMVKSVSQSFGINYSSYMRFLKECNVIPTDTNVRAPVENGRNMYRALITSYDQETNLYALLFDDGDIRGDVPRSEIEVDHPIYQLCNRVIIRKFLKQHQMA